MSRQNYRYDRYEDQDQLDTKGYIDDLRYHRKEKRIKNALRSKRIEDLLDSEDDF